MAAITDCWSLDTWQAWVGPSLNLTLCGQKQAITVKQFVLAYMHTCKPEATSAPTLDVEGSGNRRLHP